MCKVRYDNYGSFICALDMGRRFDNLSCSLFCELLYGGIPLIFDGANAAEFNADIPIGTSGAAANSYIRLNIIEFWNFYRMQSRRQRQESWMTILPLSSH